VQTENKYSGVPHWRMRKRWTSLLSNALAACGGHNKDRKLTLIWIHAQEMSTERQLKK